LLRAGLAIRGGELALLGGITLLSLLLRVHYLSDIPRYTDEIDEILPAIDIAQGRALPLVSGPKHIGAFFDYVLAGAMVVFGRSPELPRAVVLVAGTATVLLTYGYARALGGPPAGLLAAAFLAVSAPHVLLSSRVAWSASLTPLFLTGAAWALDHAVRRRQPRHVLATGLLCGLALQSHPSVGALLPGFGMFVLLRGRWLLRQPAFWAAGLLFVAGFANVLIYNWQSGLGAARSVSRQYPHEAIGLGAYAANLTALLDGLALTLASAVDPTRDPSPLEPPILLATVVCLASLVQLTRRGSPLPLLVTLSAALTMPLGHEVYAPLLGARYLMPLVPLAYVGVGVLGADLLASTDSTTRADTLRRIAVGAAAAAWLSGMLVWLLRFESIVEASGCSNAPQRAFVGELERQRAPGEWVLLDPGAVRPAERFGYLSLLKLSGQRVAETSFGRGGIWRELAERPAFLTFVDDGRVPDVFERQGLPLVGPAAAIEPAQSLTSQDRAGRRGGIGLYRVDASGPTLLAYHTQPGCGELVLN